MKGDRGEEFQTYNWRDEVQGRNCGTHLQRKGLGGHRTWAQKKDNRINYLNRSNGQLVCGVGGDKLKKER